MRIKTKRIKQLCNKQGKSLHELLADAGVSPNAYYTLARKESVLPGSVRAIAHSLNVSPLEILQDVQTDLVDPALRLIEQVEGIMSRHGKADRDNVRHTLILLSEEPSTRLERALRRVR